MTDPALRASLALWERRYAFAQQRLASAKRHHSPRLVAKWNARIRQTSAMTALRRHQIANEGPRVSRRCVNFIARFEGGQSSDGLFHAYWDANGRVWTIGYGHTHNVHPGEVLTATQARDLLWHDLEVEYAPPVFALNLPTDGQRSATISIVYNCGPGIIGPGSTLGAALRRRNWPQAAAAFPLYCRSGGRVLPGLLARRRAEAAMFSH